MDEIIGCDRMAIFRSAVRSCRERREEGNLIWRNREVGTCCYLENSCLRVEVDRGFGVFFIR